MEKVLGYGRRAWFVARVMSGYEQWRIRSLRLQIQRKIDQALESKATFTVKNVPEEVILTEYRRLVGAMQELNQTLEETEIKIDEYFKPIDGAAASIISMQLDSKEKSLKAMATLAQEQAILEIDATKSKNHNFLKEGHHKQEIAVIGPSVKVIETNTQ